MVKIFIDPGHGGKDHGAFGHGLREKDLTLKISKKIAAILKEYMHVRVKLSRTSDETLSLVQRTNAANEWDADYLLSVHINAGGGTGYEDFIFNGKVRPKTSSLRDTMHAEITKEVYIVRNRGKKKANFHMLRESRMPAMLSENLFIDTKTDAILLGTNSYLDKIAQGHVNGLVKAFSLTKKPISNPTSAEKETESTTVKNPSLIVDGKWGPLLTRSLQSYFGTVIDGVLSGQYRNNTTTALYGNTVSYGTSGSLVIKAFQQFLNSKGFKLVVDGLLGPATVRALQMYLGTVVDGELSRPSLVVKALQRRLNQGKL